ncbi:TB2/DP1, HVA22 family-domain-containing protein [Cokeromyces recurvatus]|uniref:TB2/DP1, HVA22 family-domain-containing protein n=1 Tax=Cokeromyces recurvatus TaxID=90255 RepID=UPI00221F8B8F|nr:TB2/DP1, HVA22 family-domain-containing protein [Cokeromyces recurvatus]KAI7907237.1 TB2/DP1, HVA22 family-domain-containing protein [Cokeromyces recurvatus]
MATVSPYSAQGIQTKVKDILGRVDNELSKYKLVNDFERKTGVPKSYVALGTGGIVFLMIFFNLAGQLLTSAISWLYPAYASFKAIETVDKNDDKQWLTYWTVIGFIQMIEYFSDILLYWFPFYYLFKTLFVLYLALPQFKGAEVIYSRFLRPYLLNAQGDIDLHANKLKAKLNEFSSTTDKTE